MEENASFIGVKEDLLKIFDFFKKNQWAIAKANKARVIFYGTELGSVFVNHGENIKVNLYFYPKGTITALLIEEREHKICFLENGEVTCHDADEERALHAETLLKGWIEKLKVKIKL